MTHHAHSQHIVFEFFFWLVHTNQCHWVCLYICLEWLLLCELLTWRQLYDLRCERYCALCALLLCRSHFLSLELELGLPSTNDKWQALELQNAWYTKRVSFSHIFNDNGWHFAYAMLISSSRSSDSAFYVFFKKTMMVDHIKWTIYLNSINEKRTRMNTPYVYLLDIVFIPRFCFSFYLIASYISSVYIYKCIFSVRLLFRISHFTTSYHFFLFWHISIWRRRRNHKSYWKNIHTNETEWENEKQRQTEERNSKREVNTWLSVCNSFKSFTITRSVEQTIRAINSYIPLFESASQLTF